MIKPFHFIFYHGIVLEICSSSNRRNAMMNESKKYLNFKSLFFLLIFLAFSVTLILRVPNSSTRSLPKPTTSELYIGNVALALDNANLKLNLDKSDLKHCIKVLSIYSICYFREFCDSIVNNWKKLISFFCRKNQGFSYSVSK